jgi:hypothetical protein
MFGLTGPEGNHGEDVKEYWWYLDSTPTHSWMTWRYHYPQREFPYARLVAENARRARRDPEFELADTGIFDDGRYWAVPLVVDLVLRTPEGLAGELTSPRRRDFSYSKVRGEYQTGRLSSRLSSTGHAV